MEEDPQQATDSSSKTRLPWRYIFAVLSSLGIAILHGMTIHVGVTMLAMVNHTALEVQKEETWTVHPHHHSHENIDVDDTCPIENAQRGDKIFQDGPFMWDTHVQGIMFSAYFWGYITSQIPGGLLAHAYSAKNVFGVAVAINGLLAIITPLAAGLSHFAFIIVRILQGIMAGANFPAMHALLPSWVPPQEYSQMSTIVYSGMSLGTVITLPLSGVIALYLGWEWVFYGLGFASLVWCGAWFGLVTDYPEDHRFMSKEEKEYISRSIGTIEHVHRPTPWRKLMASIPFHALWFSYLCGDTGWYMLLVELPTYLNQIHHFGLRDNSFLSAAPFLSMWLFSFLLSNRLDWARSKGYISSTGSQKIATFIASVPPALCLVGVTLVGCDRTAVVALMVVAVTCLAGMYPGCMTNLIRIAPHYAGTLMGLCNTVGTVPGIVMPYIVGQLTHKNQTLSTWKMIFYGTALVYCLKAIVYTAFSSGEKQPWNDNNQKVIPMAEAVT